MVPGVDRLRPRDEVGEEVLGDEEIKGLRVEGISGSLKIMMSPINICVQVSV